MNRVEFMQQLERLLWDIPQSDRLDAIAYYNDYFDEAGAENEAQVIRELGSPGKVAAIIKADLNASGNAEAEYTEQGYKDGREGVNQNTPARKENGYQVPKQKRSIPWVLIIILLVFASPVLVGVGGGLLGAIFGVLAALFGIVVAVIVCAIALVLGGIMCIVVGIARAITSPVEGLVVIGVGAILFALGILFTILFIWCAFKWLPALFRWTVDLIQKLFHRGERRNAA